MHRNYLKMALRYLLKNKVHSFINIAGLSVGMTVAMLIGLWIRDECTYDRFPAHYEQIAQVYKSQVFNGEIKTGRAISIPLPGALKARYGEYFKQMALTSWNWGHILSAGDKKLLQRGNFMEATVPEMFSMHMLRGDRKALTDPHSMILSQTVARALFGDANPMGLLVKLDNDQSFRVTGVYEDFPYNSDFNGISFIAPWEFYLNNPSLVKPRSKNDWGDNSYQLYVQLADHADMEVVNAKIADLSLQEVDAFIKQYNPKILLHPMSRWHLYPTFKNGVAVGDRLQYVWMFGIIGVFVLLLACINFMNLTTARSEKRAKEVGIRKSIGSMRLQLVAQFFTESLFVTMIAYVLAIGFVLLLLPAFNEVADKQIALPWRNPLFWLAGLSFAVLTGLIAGTYPAFYLSSFQPVKVLKGSYKAGKLASMPRKVLVVLQFSVSVTLIIGTIVVFRQIQYARNRPVGYDREGLVTVPTITAAIADHFASFRQELLATGKIDEVAFSTSPATGVNNNTSSIRWPGKDPDMTVDFANIGVSFGFGKAVGWQFTAGRDFNAGMATDSDGMVLNQRAVEYMGLKEPVGKTITWGDHQFRVLGIVKDMVMQNPYEVVMPTVFYIRDHFMDNYVSIRIRPGTSAVAAVQVIADMCRKYDPESPVNYKFADAMYEEKFRDEIRVGKLAGIFALLAIFISCLGLFGMASFMAEQRTKELGIRKILGASVFNLWGMLSKEFIILVMISFLVAMPLAHVGMAVWLERYTYRTVMPWWAFVVAAGGAMVITLATVSVQGIKAAMMNPVKSLKME
ncbi:ABC transporter permease [Chitinophaga sancti]|uniref:ABC transporter permease n=1 Tax=Chitinophaga sancti TaxID=1004 RepID=A0A1K1S4X4_9BACT|nr:ABC transporter permease [Chitinophaga sancti]WQD63670.1 ABC transporter permease [Chitinophaga sancti]WQG90705.1 ABC transporter permease [Chitinophaga sancti]SFW79395.1 ABC-type antimicrobial peptide transport system, permease component [Chitinophaga sancti]